MVQQRKALVKPKKVGISKRTRNWQLVAVSAIRAIVQCIPEHFAEPCHTKPY